MTLPFAGDWIVDVHAARPYTIHGDLYYEIHVLRADVASEQPMILRLPQHAIPRPPEPGDRLRVTFLMGQITAARPVA